MKKSGLLFAIALLVLSCSGTPQMSISPIEHDAGKVIAKEKIEVWFVIENTGKTPLIIENIRPLCDCISVEEAMDTIPPGLRDSILVEYVAPEKVGEDVSSLMLRTNADPKNTKLTIKAEVIETKLEKGDSTIAIVPFQNRGIAGGNEYSLDLFRYLVEHLPAGFKPINPNDYANAIQTDPKYGKQAIQDVARKYNRILGIRYGVFGEIRPNPAGGTDASIMLVDGFFHLPIGRILEGMPEDVVYKAISDTINSFLQKPQEYVRQAMLADLQQKWAEQRAKLLNKPAPDITAQDIRTGNNISLSDFRGKPLVIQFFSTDCDHCEEEMEWLSRLVTDHEGIAALGISVNIGERDSVIEYIKDKHLKYPVILPDEKGEKQLDPYYGGATPQTVIISPQGLVVESFAGFSKSVMANFERLLVAMLNQEPQTAPKRE
jgi:peroxiredoxin